MIGKVSLNEVDVMIKMSVLRHNENNKKCGYRLGMASRAPSRGTREGESSGHAEAELVRHYVEMTSTGETSYLFELRLLLILHSY